MTPDNYTISENFIKTADGVHELYVQEWGNPKGEPVLFLHGGPGAGCNDGHKNTFDPQLHHVIFFDQRGAGKSQPHGSLENNTSQYLIEDIELISTKFGWDKFHVFGRSWGSALALQYAIAYPDQVKSLIVGGIYMATKQEREWIKNGSMSTFFPEAWAKMLESVPAGNQSAPMEFLERKVLDSTGAEQSKWASVYSQMILSVLGLDDRPKTIDPETFDPAPYIIEAHYSQNHEFMDDEYILNNANKITMPVHIIQGRYDILCPPVSANKLHKALPQSKIHWTIAGHSNSDRANYDVSRAVLSQLS